MLITYRRTGGGFLLLLTLAALLVAAVLTVAVGAALLIGGVAIGAVVLLVRAVLPASWRRRTKPPGTPWPQETIEATAVHPRDSSGERGLLRIDGDRG
jgi:membrane protein implicated in regulation of membrane protease activity